MHTQSWWHFVCTEYHGQMVMSKHMLQNRIYIDGPIRTCSDNRHRSVLWRELGMRTKKSKQITIDFPALIDCADVYPRLKCSFFLFQLFPGQVSSFYNYFPANQRLKTIPFIMFITTLDLHSETESEHKCDAIGVEIWICTIQSSNMSDEMKKKSRQGSGPT